jgi:hypothetical protein
VESIDDRKTIRLQLKLFLPASLKTIIDDCPIKQIERLVSHSLVADFVV